MSRVLTDEQHREIGLGLESLLGRVIGQTDAPMVFVFAFAGKHFMFANRSDPSHLLQQGLSECKCPSDTTFRMGHDG